MWAVYKKEIVAREKNEKDFLKNYYKRHRDLHETTDGDGGATDGADLDANIPQNVPNGDLKSTSSSVEALRRDSDFEIQLDSDEEPLSLNRGGSGNEGTKLDHPGEKKAAAASAVGQEQQQENESTVLEQFGQHKANYDDSKLPKWLYKYLVYRFNLLDRTGE
jgi:hypothetical protein